ncbi:restriction endonuclease subunit S [Streptomyces fradiae]|uniref:restriction endonuclease subunit S n=1 Tax=Streptomyces fradiae TaxID=1906 RepID=UPI00294383D3|nr:restriction endonuclease subunit S [Streptomyces fradiae]WOI62332.1 restriction endonuclease subunit S [Streptomyces fradiae]
MTTTTANWSRSRLKRLARLEYGLGQPPRLSEAGVPILRATNINRGKISPAGLIYAALSDLPLDRAPLLRTGEILVVRSGAYTGDSALVTDEWAGSAPGYDLRVTPRSVVPRYLAYCLLSSAVMQQMDIAKSRAAQPHLNAEELGEVIVDLPALSEQCHIADFLDSETARIDALLDARKRQLDRLKELWTSRLAAAVESMISTYGIIPLRRVVRSVEQGWSPQCEDALAGPDEWAVLKTSAVSSGVFRPREHKKLPNDLQPDFRFRILDGDLLMTRGSGSVEHVGVPTVAATEGRNLLLSDLLYRVRADRGWSHEFLALMLRSRPVRGFMSLLLRGQSGQTIKLRSEDIKGIYVPSVPVEQQVGLVADLSAEERSIEEARAAIEVSSALLAERRQALITAAVTGQLGVTTARPTQNRDL